MLSNIQELMDTIRDWVTLPTELLPQLALARAAGGEFPRLDTSYDLPEENAYLHLLVTKNEKNMYICLVKVFDQRGELSEALDDAIVVGKHGEPSEPFKGGQTEITLDMIKDGFVILRSNQTQVKMQAL